MYCFKLILRGQISRLKWLQTCQELKIENMKNEEVVSCFKTYDIRGKLGSEINSEVAYRIGFSVAKKFKAQNIVVGFDARKSSPELSNAIIKGIVDYGANVFALGLAGTEEVYFSTAYFAADAGIEVTASHNPIEYNGMKIVKSGSKPLEEAEFLDIKSIATEKGFRKSNTKGKLVDVHKEARNAYVNKLLSFVSLDILKPLRIVVNSGNGAAGPVIDSLIKNLKNRGVVVNFEKIHHEPDQNFPNGIPNPLLEENRKATSDAVKSFKGDFGVAFDGDFDRCFIFDGSGRFIPSEYIVGLLAEVFLLRESCSTIVYDPRVILNTLDTVKKFNGKSQISKTGHIFLKQSMRKAEAIYGGEMSGHHYFRDFCYCDSGMIPWIMIWELLSRENVALSELISSRRDQFPSSGEINFSPFDVEKCLKGLKEKYAFDSIDINELDGLSIAFKTWRFNIRKSNTEPLVRLNVEAIGDKQLLKRKIKELSQFIENL